MLRVPTETPDCFVEMRDGNGSRVFPISLKLRKTLRRYASGFNRTTDSPLFAASAETALHRRNRAAVREAFAFHWVHRTRAHAPRHTAHVRNGLFAPGWKRLFVAESDGLF